MLAAEELAFKRAARIDELTRQQQEDVRLPLPLRLVPHAACCALHALREQAARCALLDAELRGTAAAKTDAQANSPTTLVSGTGPIGVATHS